MFKRLLTKIFHMRIRYDSHEEKAINFFENQIELPRSFYHLCHSSIFLRYCYKGENKVLTFKTKPEAMEMLHTLEVCDWYMVTSGGNVKMEKYISVEVSTGKGIATEKRPVEVKWEDIVLTPSDVRYWCACYEFEVCRAELRIGKQIGKHVRMATDYVLQKAG